MPKFTIDHNSQLNSDECYSQIKKFLSEDQDIRKMDSKIQCEFNDAKKSGSAKGSQFKADILVSSASSGSKVQVTVDLPLLLSPFKGKVQETLERKLKKLLG